MSQRCFQCGSHNAPHPMPSRLTPQQQAENQAWAASLNFHTGHCPHLELPTYACDDHAAFHVGQRVRTPHPHEPFGVVAQLVTDKGGYLVRHPSGSTLGWSVHELQDATEHPSRFDRPDPLTS